MEQTKKTKKKKKQMRFRDTGKMELIVKADGSWSHYYKCPAQSYFIDEPLCNLRQEKGYFKTCRRCTFRIGGKNDPRERGGE